MRGWLDIVPSTELLKLERELGGRKREVEGELARRREKKLMKREASSTLGDTVWRYLKRIQCATAVQNASRCYQNSNRGEEKDIDEKQRQGKK